MCSALVSARGLKNEVYSFVARLVRLYGLKNEIYSCVARLIRVMDYDVCFGMQILMVNQSTDL